METSLKTGFAQIFSCCPKNLSCPKFWGAAPSPPRPVRLCSEDPKKNHLQGQHHYLELDGHRANDAIDTIQFNVGCCVPLVKNPAP